MNSGLRSLLPGIVVLAIVIAAPPPLKPLDQPVPATKPSTTSTAPLLRFEEASVKVHPAPPGAYMIKNYKHSPPYVIPTSATFIDTAHVQDLIMEAYGVVDSQIRYLPAWTLSPSGLMYDVEAKAEGSAPPTPAQLQEMLQSLLKERFHLGVHWETKTKVSVYALVVDKNGPKFKEFHEAPLAATDAERAAIQPYTGTSLFALARFLTQNFDGPVFDRTGLPAVQYDFDLNKLLDFEELDREQRTDPLAAADYIRSIVPHELGLRMESRKENIDYLIIDHVDQPSDK